MDDKPQLTMQKYFIADKHLLNKCNGYYCINGFGNCDKQFFVSSLSNYCDCSHTTCHGAVLEIKNDYSLKLNFVKRFNFASGDVGSKSASDIRLLILLYDENEIISVIPTCDKQFLTEIGNDCTYILSCLAKLNSIYLNIDLIADIKEKIQEKQDKKSRLLSFMEHSYLYRWTKCRQIDIRKRNVNGLMSSMAMECLLALILIMLLFRFIFTGVDKELDQQRLIGLINTFVKLLQDLLNWLMGVPVGLKLNRQFSKVLGQFYMFHVTIWENYMHSSVVPLLPYLLNVIPFLAPLGISFFLCALLDISAIVTLHLTCFYIYACKLYRLQIIILCSLYRLFHGQKWNPFRERVDTGPSEIDRLFTSTLILALTVFLLPTTALYYLVFASIELVLFIHECLVSGLVQLIYRLPILEFVSWLLNQPRHKKIVQIDKVTESETCLLLRIKFTRSPLSSIFRSLSHGDIPIQPQITVKEILSSLFRGHLLKRR